MYKKNLPASRTYSMLTHGFTHKNEVYFRKYTEYLEIFAKMFAEIKNTEDMGHCEKDIF